MKVQILHLQCRPEGQGVTISRPCLSGNIHDIIHISLALSLLLRKDQASLIDIIFHIFYNVFGQFPPTTIGRDMRKSHRWIAAATVAVLGAAGVAIPLVLRHQSQDIYTDSPERRQYQATLDASPDRFEPRFELVVVDGLFWIRTDYGLSSRNPCEKGCATVTNGAVSLPVGYTQQSNVEPLPTKFAPVSSLTYWNPILHKQETIRPTAGQASVALPAFLVEPRDLASLQVGETIYTTTDFVRRTPQGTVYVFNVNVFSYEPLDSYGRYSQQAAFTRSKAGVCVRMPEGVTMRPVAPEDVQAIASNPQWTQITVC